jgi:chromosome segregation ATPase
VLATNIDVHVKAQEKMIQQQADGDLKDIKAKIVELQEMGANFYSFRSDYVEPMHGQLTLIQQKLVQNADDAESTKTSYKTLIDGLQADIQGQIKLIKDEQIGHKEELHNAAEEFERLSLEIDSMKGSITNVSTTINEQLNIKFVSNRDELLAKLGEVERKVINNQTTIVSNAEGFQENINKLKESLDKVSLNLNEQIVLNIESSNQGFENKIGDIYAKIHKNGENIVNNNNSVNNEINILKQSIDKMSTNFGEQIEVNITSHKESYDLMFGEIEDKLKKLHEEQLNHKDELSNAAEEFETINKELESLRESLQNTTTSVSEKLQLNFTSNNEAIDVRFGEIDEKINKTNICINHISEASKQDITKLRDELDSITANAREQLEISINSNRDNLTHDIEIMNGRITKNETDISNLQDGAAEQNKKIQVALDNMSLEVDEKIEINKNAINVTIKEIAEDNEKIRSIENQLAGLAENQNNANTSILKLETDISSLNAVTQKFETKVEEVTVLATNIDVHVKAQEQMIQQQTEGDMN